MTDADKCTHMGACSECRAVVAAERDHVEAWKTATLTKLGQCETCSGEGLMEAVEGCDSVGQEYTTPEPCAECGGTGRGDVRRAIELAVTDERVRQVKADQLLDGMALLQSFVDRFGDVPEFAPIVGPISAYLIGESGDGEG